MTNVIIQQWRSDGATLTIRLETDDTTLPEDFDLMRRLTEVVEAAVLTARKK